MAVILIEPIQINTRNGYTVSIYGIEPNAHDCVRGEITLPNGSQKGSWNSSGFMRGGTDGTNIDPSDPDFKDVIETAQALSATKL